LQEPEFVLRISAKYLLPVLACLAVLQLPAQTSGSTPTHHDTPFVFYARAMGMVPHPVSNKAFRRSFTGIYDAHAGFNAELIKGFTLGVDYNNQLWKTPDNKIPGLNSYAQFNEAGLRAGYQMMGNATTMYYVGFTGGRAFIKYSGLSYQTQNFNAPLPPPKTNYSGTYLEPELGVLFFTEGNFAIGLNVSWAFYDYVFDPYAIYLNQHKAYDDSDLKGQLQQFNFGFSMTFGFKKK
jgi:hypothetical protein